MHGWMESMDGLHGWMDCIDAWMDGWIALMHGWMDGLHGWMDCMDAWMDGWIALMHGWMDGWIAWMDGLHVQMYLCVYIYSYICMYYKILYEGMGMGMGMDMDYYHLAYFVEVLVIVLRESLQFTYVVKNATSQHSMREGSGGSSTKKNLEPLLFFCGLQARAPATKKKSWGRTRDSFYCWEGLEPGAQKKNWGRGSRISFCGRPLSFLKKKVRRSLIYYICI
jgi:hypothetical protein